MRPLIMQGNLRKRFTVFLLSYSFAACAQQKMTLAQCEKAFLTSNLTLLAARYDVSTAEAQIIQAGLWEYPYLTAELNAADPQNGKAFNAGRNGQKAVTVQQLIYLGGKKKAEVALATAQAGVAKLQLRELLLRLRYRLRTTFYSVYYDGLTVASIERRSEQLDTLLNMYQQQVQKGNVPLRDLVRLQSLQMALKNDRAQLLSGLLEEQKNLAVLTGNENGLLPAPDSSETVRYGQPLSSTLQDLLRLAQQNSVEILLSDKQKEAAGRNWKWQKALAVPDVTVGLGYDQNGGAFRNQFNLLLGMPLRLWNKNQGAVKMAEAQYGQALVTKDAVLLQKRSEVTAAWKKYNDALANYRFATTGISRQLEDVYRGLFFNFQRRNVSLIEFTDFMESYNESRVQINAAGKALALACEELNYATGTILF